jgi:glucose/arabinose dehydrogenase
MREKGVPEKYVRLVMDMYDGAHTRVRSSVGLTERFPVRVGVHQGSALSPYLFNMVMDVLTAGVREQAPWTMLFADDIVLVDESKEGVEEKLENWRQVVEDGGLRISRTKTEYMWFGGEGNTGDVKLLDQRLTKTGEFKYLGSYVTEKGELDREVMHRIQAGWMNWKKMTGVLCDRRIRKEIKGKVFKSVVRPAMIYGSETWPVKKAHEKRLEVAEMRMLRWTLGKTRRDRIRNDTIREMAGVIEISRKVQEGRLQWFGHVMRREEDHVVRRVSSMQVEGRRGRGRTVWWRT